MSVDSKLQLSQASSSSSPSSWHSSAPACFLYLITPLTNSRESRSKCWRERAAFQRSAFGRSTAGNDVVATIFIRLFSFFFFFPVFFPFFFSSVATFSHRRSARIKKLILRKLLRMPINLGVDTFPDPVGHFGAHWQPFWILQVVQGYRR